MKSKEYNLDSTVKLIIRVLIVVSIFIGIKLLSNILFPFVMGWFIAYFIYPIVCFIQYKMRVRNRIISIILALIFVFGSIVGLCFWIIPMIYQEFVRVVPIITNYINSSYNSKFFNETILKNVQDFLEKIDYNNFLTVDSLKAFLDRVLPEFWSLISNVWQLILGIVTLLLVLLYMVFILYDYETINDTLVKAFPKKYRLFVSSLKEDLSKAMNKYFRGSALIGLIIGILYSIGFSIIGLPLPIVMGITIGVLSIVPYLQFVAFVPVIFLAFINSLEPGGSFGLMMLGVLINFAIMQTLMDVVLLPKIMGKNMGLRPAVILLSLSVFGYIFGFIGLIIALPMTTIIISYYSRYVIGNESIMQ